MPVWSARLKIIASQIKTSAKYACHNIAVELKRVFRVLAVASGLGDKF